MRQRVLNALVGSIVFIACPAIVMGQDAGAQPAYPGHGPQTKIESDVNGTKIRVFGTVLLNTSAADGGLFGQDLPLWTLPSTGTVTYPDGTTGQSGNNHDLIFTMRQSIIGLSVTSAASAGWTPSALVEMDFFGPRPVDTSTPQNRVLTQPRLRKAYFQVEKNSLKLVFGQDGMIAAPLDPVSLSHVAEPLGAAAGNLWAWLPQARIEWKPAGSLLVQAGVLRPQFGDTRLDAEPATGTSIDTTSSGLGERSTQPFYQARIALSAPMRGSNGVVGVSGHMGEERIGVDRNLKSSLAALDAKLPFDPHVIVRGEAYTGKNLIPFQGGVDQGAAVVTGVAPIIQAIRDKGGWGELTILPSANDRDAVYAGYATDHPKTSDLLPGSGRARNSFIWASYFHKFGDQVTAAFEWSNWQFQTVAFTGSVAGATTTSKANVFNLSLAYQF